MWSSCVTMLQWSVKVIVLQTKIVVLQIRRWFVVTGLLGTVLGSVTVADHRWFKYTWDLLVWY